MSHRVDQEILAWAQRTPSAVAVGHAGEQRTYADLAERTWAIAGTLAGHSVGPGDRVLLGPERSLDTLPAMLATWWVGAIAVPLPESAPTARLEALIDDCRPRVAIGDVPPFPGPQFLPQRCRPSDPPSPQWRDDAYIFSTSGTTGRPKGVCGNHAALHHYVSWQGSEFQVEPGQRFSQIAPSSFDFALKEWLVPVSRGASVWVVPEALRNDGAGLMRWMAAHEIHSVCCLPLMFRELASSLADMPEPTRAELLTSLRRLYISGDMLYWSDVDRWRAVAGHDVALVNLYGPTESTIIKAFYPIPPSPPSPSSSVVPVGQAIPDTELVILDGERQVDPGDVGEVVIRSRWLARYIKPDPGDGFVEGPPQDLGLRVYRTGDRGRFDRGGNLELLGRNDGQVKVRGVRVDTRGIEAQLRPHARDVAVLALAADERPEADRELVCAFVDTDPDAATTALRNHANRLLAPAERPSRFVSVPALPRTANGKIDRDALAAAIAPLEPAAAAGLTKLEQVTALWREILGVDPVAPDANFFELGGDSMRAVTLLRRLRTTFAVRVRLPDILTDMTPRGISRYLERGAQ